MWGTTIFQALIIPKLVSVFPLEPKDTVNDNIINRMVMRKRNSDFSGIILITN